MTRAEKTLASRLLDVAAAECDKLPGGMDPEYFDDLEPEEIEELVEGFNNWRRGKTGETCGDSDDREWSLPEIGENFWMSYLAAVLGRPRKHKRMVAKRRRHPGRRRFRKGGKTVMRWNLDIRALGGNER